MSDPNRMALALEHHRAGRLDDAADLYRQVLRVRPDHEEALCLLGLVALQRGNAGEAAALAAQAMAVAPGQPAPHNLRGQALWRQGDAAGAEDCFRRAVALAPGFAQAHHNLGTLLRARGRLDEAIASFELAVRAEPRHAAAHYHLGQARRARGDLAGAADAFRRATDLEPAFTDAVAALAEATLALGRPAEALPLWEKALAAAPDRAGLHAGLADARHALGDCAAAVEAYRLAVALDERLTAAWWGMGCAQLTLKRFADAAESLTRVVALAPDHGEARHNLGRALSEIGRIDEALDAFREVLARHGPNPLTLGMIATLVPGSPRADDQVIRNERRAWARHCAPPGPPRRFDHLRTPGARRLRVGYVSSFFHHRNWMKPVWGLINHHDREQFEVHLFSDAPASQVVYGYRPDPRDRFHDISRRSNADVAEHVYREGIDLLVDLNAYSKLPRLPLFPLRPAPVIVSWFSLYATSGLDCYDRLLVDEHVIRPEEEPFYGEPITRLPACYLTFEVGYPVPDVVPPPCLPRGHLTFGCPAPQYKITPQAVEAWARVLRDSPGSRLVLKNKVLGSPDARRYLAAAFARLDIPPDRVELDGPDEHYQFLEKYNDIDLTLDTFPYNGGTTTEESLWQGVPVLAFDGGRWTARISASILRYAGLTEFVAPDLDGYVRLAVALANDPGTPARLAELRRTMRERLGRASLCDVRGYARLVEGEYRRLWERFLKSGAAPAS